MQTLIMTSPKITGPITFAYNEQGFLETLTISSTLTAEQYKAINDFMPWSTSLIDHFTMQFPKCTFARLRKEVTFDMFWARANPDGRSSKAKTLKAWNKFPYEEQVKAYLYYPIYDRNRGNAERKYATTYLSDQLWNN